MSAPRLHQRTPSASYRYALSDAAKRLLEEEHGWHTRPRSDGLWGLDTGFPAINYATGGLHPGELTVLGARTNHGKSALINQIVFHVAETLSDEAEATGNPNVGQVVLFNPEMTVSQILMRRACSESNVPARRLQQGIAEDWEREAWRRALQRAVELQPYLTAIAGGSLDVTDLVDILEGAQEFGGGPVRLAVVDYIQRIVAGGQSSGYERTSEVSLRLKDATNRLNIPMIVASQMKRPEKRLKDGSEPPPTMADLRESGRLEEDADNVWVLFREKMLGGPGGGSGASSVSKASLLIEKQRSGPQAVIPLAFAKNVATFRDDITLVQLDGE